MSEELCIDINCIVKYYKYKPILKDLTLQVPCGSVFGLLGINGVGKTTLIKCILGLLKTNAGHISVLSDNPFQLREATKAQIGYVPQNERIYPWLTVDELIRYISSFYPHWNQMLVNDLLKEWHIDTTRKYGVLSEGEAQKVAIILAMGHEPALFVFDEPVASLDPAARRQFLKTILDIVLDRNCTVFFSTHITSDLERIADHVAVMKEGTIDFTGELGTLKDEVKRIRVVSECSMDSDVNIKGVLSSEVTTSEALLTVRGYDQVMHETLERMYQGQVIVEDLNLEEIFLELNR